MGDGGGAGVRAWVPAALVVEVAACRRRQAAHVIMVVMVIKGMDGVSTNHSCEWKWTWIHTHTHTNVYPAVVMKDVEVLLVRYTHMQFSFVNTLEYSLSVTQSQKQTIKMNILWEE